MAPNVGDAGPRPASGDSATPPGVSSRPSMPGVALTTAQQATPQPPSDAHSVFAATSLMAPGPPLATQNTAAPPPAPLTNGESSDRAPSINRDSLDIDQWTASMDAPSVLAPQDAAGDQPGAMQIISVAPAATPSATIEQAVAPVPTVGPTASSPPPSAADAVAAGASSPLASQGSPGRRGRRNMRSVEPSDRVMRTRK
ncbi:hypothetical protein CBOM_06543 [Ceraceosorus bombacis]|uniref:Uncharacterized protein n=1 Tax=Ceraceosorus bombacis TaxID=401625 RepID=A0A0N7LAH6_9BASI|nr:hypothetical protein CBOM_06543 [Ceraceosorus bombacis]